MRKKRTPLVLQRRRSLRHYSEYRKVISESALSRIYPADVSSADISDLQLPSTMKTIFPNPDDLLNFELSIEPDEGMYKGGRFTFTFNILPSYPHEAPKVLCKEKIYHPNIDLEGKVCLNILREDWKPVLNLQSVVVGLQVGFTLCSLPPRSS